MHKYTYTNSQLNTWCECKRKYYFKYVKKINIPEKKTNFELGRNVHALINYYLKGHDIAIIEKNLDEETTNHWYAVKNYPLLKNKTIKSEWEFNSRVGDTKYWLNGRVDAIFLDGNSKIIIADWKTGQNIPKNPETSLQASVYLYSVFRAQKDLKLSINYEDLSFFYIKTPECKEVCINYSAEKEKMYEKTFLNIINEVETFDFDKKIQVTQNKKCQNCPYSAFC